MPTFHALSAVKWGATRARAPPPLHSFRIVAAGFPPTPSPYAMPFQQPNPGKANVFGGCSAFFSEFSEVFFSFFSVLFFVFFWGFEILHFPFFWVGAFPNPSPQHKVYFPTLAPPPKPKATHPKQSNAVENATMQVNCCCWFPSLICISADTDVLCVSTEAKGRSGKRTEALRATQHAGQAWMATNFFGFGMRTQI